MAGPTRAGRRGPDVDPFGSPTRDAPPSEWDDPRPPRRPNGNGHPNGHAHGNGRGNGNGGPPGRRNGGGPSPQPTSGGPGGRPPAGGRSGERPAPRKRSIIWRWRRAFFLLALMGLLAVAAGGAVLAQTELPAPKTFRQATFICAANLQPGQACNEDTAIAKLQGDDANRVNVAYDDLSPHIINAVVATEDRNFFTHDGVAPLGIARALYRDLKGDQIQQGGSTITQQYVKNAYLTSERSLTRKLKEAVLSIKLEQRMSKQEILENYLNTVYFGRGSYGIQAASRAYFNTDASKLDIGQAAYLAGLMRAPEAADASLHPEEAARRRQTSLTAMEQEGYISADEADLYSQVTFEAPYFLPRQSSSRVTTLEGSDYGAEYVTTYVAQLLMDENGPFGFTEEEVYGGGLRVHTSIDLDMQGRAWAAVRDVLNQPGDPQAGMVAVDDQGMVRAMVGARPPAGGEVEKPEINFAVRGSGSDGRAVGSTFKPIAIAEAVATGKSLDSRYDAPATLTIDQSSLQGCAPEYKLSNYAESEGGNLDLVEATAQSSNTAFAQLMVDLTPQKVIDMAKKLGMPGDFEDPCPSMVLGTENASPLDMAGVYSVFANRGVKKTPALITRVDQIGDDGKVTTLYNRQPPAGEQVLTPQQADLVTHALQSVITDGTGKAADIGRPAAGKTGTSNEYKDAWFVGYVPKLTAAVWMGYEKADWIDPETGKESLPPMSPRGIPVHGGSATGGSFPAQIWHDFMVSTLDARGWNDPFTEVPEDLIEAGIRLDEGRIPEETTTTPPPQQQPGTPPPPDDGPGRPRPTRPGGGNTTTTEEPTTTSSSTSTTTDTTAPPTSDTTIIPTLPTRPGGGGGPGADTG